MDKTSKAINFQQLFVIILFVIFSQGAPRNKFIADHRNTKIQEELLNSEDDTTFDQTVSKSNNLEQIDEDEDEEQAGIC